MIPVLFREIMSLIVILSCWYVGYQLHAWSQQGRALALRYLTVPDWVGFFCGRSTGDGQLTLSGLLIQGGAWLWAVVWVSLMILRIPEDPRAAVFLVFFILLLFIFLALAVVQAVSRIMKKF